MIYSITDIRDILVADKLKFIFFSLSLAHIFYLGYVPDGLSESEWKKLQSKESSEKSKKKFSAYGPITFKSRSLQAFQKDLEQGKANHLMPMMFAKEKIKKGEIKKEDVPYMQRGKR